MRLLLATALVFAATSFTAFAADVPTISVSGAGTVNVVPDMATTSLTVTREAPTAREALTANNVAMAQVLAAMKGAGIEERDLGTTNFNINPVYSRPNPKRETDDFRPEIVGYTVSNTLTVRVRDLANLGGVLDQAVTLGVNSGGGLTFSSSKPDEALKEARAKAVKNAIDKATTMVDAAGVRLGRILSMNEQSRRPPVMQKFAQARVASMVAEDAAVPVAAGEGSYTVTVNVTWEIAQ